MRTRTLIASIATFLTVLGFMPSAAYAQQGQAGTTLSATVTAEGYSEQRQEYDWSIDKSASPSALQIKPGETSTVTYTLNITRTPLEPTYMEGVRGEVCVTNGGDRETEGLKIVAQVQGKSGSGQFQDISGAAQTIVPAQQLNPGQTQCYPYQVTFDADPNMQYRVAAQVTITNHSGQLGIEFGPQPKATFSIPSQPTLIEIDETALLNDVLTCPTGMTCNVSRDLSNITVSGSTTITYTVNVTNNSVECNQNVIMPNVVTLVESDTFETHTAEAVVNINTGECPPPVLACTRTIGYWKNHAGAGPQEDAMSALLPVWLGTVNGTESIQVTSTTQAIQILKKEKASNGIEKLYAQLLAAKLNIEKGASDESISAVIDTADAFLANHNAGDWKPLSKQQQSRVLQWMTTLDRYNNGQLAGAPHCE